MKRVIVLMFVSACIMLAFSETASAGTCTVSVFGWQKDVFGNKVWEGATGYFPVGGDVPDSSACWNAAYNAVLNVTYSTCQSHKSAVTIGMAGLAYLDGSYVGSPNAPSSCRTDFGLNYYTTLDPGDSLNPGDSLSSPSGSYELKYQVDANLVLYQGSVPHWAINCWPVCTNQGNAGITTMQTDGNFVVYDDASNAVWNSGTSGHSGAFLAVHNNGQVYVFSPSGGVLWSAP